jgi:tetratricopeptide (TPR) repeat protein
MNKIIMTAAFLLAFCLTFSAQTVQKPTLKPTDPTPEQEKLIKQGIALHDAKKYDEAIALYQKVLDENPDCVFALYEMALSFYAKKDHVKTVETSMRGMKYKSKELPLFYGLVANIWDDQGNPQKAIALYKDGIKMLEKEKGNEQYLSSLYFNLGVTYFRQKDGPKAKDALKKAVEYNYAYPSPHYLLSETFFAMRYRVPALLAAARLMSVENFSERTKRASLVFREVLTGGAKKGNDSNSITIFVDTDEPKDEGDFSGLSLILGLASAGADIKEENKNLSEEEKFVEKVDVFIGFLASDAKKTRSTFVGKNYIPFLLEMRRRGYVKPFAYIVLANAGNEAAARWVLSDNQKTVVEFMNWAKSYQPPK